MSANITRLPGTDAPEQSHLARELDYLKARQARRLRRQLNEPPRDRYRWRRMAWALGIETCGYCGGAGEITPIGIYGEYEGSEPCWVCQPATFTGPFDADEPPF